MRQTKILIPVRAVDSWPDKMHEVAKKLREALGRDYQVRPCVAAPALVVSFEEAKGRVGWWAECVASSSDCVEVVIRSIRLANEHVWTEAYKAFAPELARAARERCRGGRPQWRPDWSAIERAGGCVVGRADAPEVSDQSGRVVVSDNWNGSVIHEPCGQKMHPAEVERHRCPALTHNDPTTVAGISTAAAPEDEDPDDVAQPLAARVVPSVKMARFSLHVGEGDELAARFATATAARAHADAVLAHRAVSVRMDDDPRPIAWRDAGELLGNNGMLSVEWRPGDDDLLWAVEP